LNSGEANNSAGGLYGAGGGGDDSGSGNARSGGQGVIRIIWPGTTRTFPYVAGK
jgi:hypothetical protein